MDFKSAAELLKLCEEENLPISQVMRRREMSETGAALPDIDRRMARAWEIMTESAKTPLTTPGKSMGGLIGGEAKKLADHQAAGKGLCGDVLGAAMTYAMAVLEVNSSMGLIVAAPTAGSAGVVPGLLLGIALLFIVSRGRGIIVVFVASAGNQGKGHY